MFPAVTMIFFACFLSIMAGYFALAAARNSPAAELKRRLKRLAEAGYDESAPEVTAELLREVSPAERFLSRLPLLDAVQRLVVQSGSQMHPSTFLMIMASGSLGSFLLVYLLKKNFLVAVVVAAATGTGFVMYLNYRRRERERKFTEQLPDALTMIARSLRAGHSFTGAVELLGQELGEPAGGLFKTVYEQQQLGMRVTDAMTLLLDRIESTDLRFFVTIVNINSEIGGNLAEILDKLGNTVRSRLQVKRQVRVYTAQGRLSGYVLAVLPVITFFGLYLMLPGYLDVFFREPKAQYILGGAVCAEVVGFLIIRKIIDIRI